MEQNLLTEEQYEKYFKRVEDNEILNGKETEVLINEWLEEMGDEEWEKEANQHPEMIKQEQKVIKK